MSQYLEFFGFKNEPFPKQIAPKNLLKLPDMVGVKERLNYTIEHGGVMLITGEVGSGKSTSVRWALSHFHPNELTVIEVVATSASIGELYKEICWGLNLDVKSASRSYLIKLFRNSVRDLVIGKKQKLLLLQN